ncbi:MAG: glycoside hydrolase [Thermoplasmata archaeon]|nr:glycoside hydrolase [Thermoplasmata archaeon]
MADKRVRVFIGTRKGAYIAESDRGRKKWAVRGPYHAGNDVFHVVPDPRSPGNVYAAVNNSFLGPMIFRSTDSGKKWTELAPPMMTVLKERPDPFSSDSTASPKFPIVNLWHVTPGPPEEPKTLFLGVDPASLYRSDDLGASWTGVAGINDHATRPKWNPGAGGMCLHTILLDPKHPKRMHIGISAAGTFRSDDGGDHWRPTNKGVLVDFLPEKNPEVGQCVHKVALDPADPSIAYRQDHNGIHVSHDGAETWTRVGKPLPDDFGFVTAVGAQRPGVAYFVPLDGRARIAPGRKLQIYKWTDKARKFTPVIRASTFGGDLGTHREGLAIDGLDPPGIYLGTTTGQLIYSPDGDTSWRQIPYMFPGIHSVTVSPSEAVVS